MNTNFNSPGIICSERFKKKNSEITYQWDILSAQYAAGSPLAAGVRYGRLSAKIHARLLISNLSEGALFEGRVDEVVLSLQGVLEGALHRLWVGHLGVVQAVLPQHRADGPGLVFAGSIPGDVVVLVEHLVILATPVTCTSKERHVAPC